LVLVALGFLAQAEQQVQIPYSQPLPQAGVAVVVHTQTDFLVALVEVLQ
jgi:hypothetical protein